MPAGAGSAGITISRAVANRACGIADSSDFINARLTSYFPAGAGRHSPEFTFSSHRSRSSRAADTNFGSFLIFSFLGRFGFSTVVSADLGLWNFSPPPRGWHNSYVLKRQNAIDDFPGAR